MGKKRLRDMTWDDYGISKHRYQELKAFCLQYEEKKNKIRYGLSAVQSDGQPKAHNTGSQVENQAIENANYQRDCEMIEQAAIKTCPDLYRYIIKSVSLGLAYEHVEYDEKAGRIPVGKTDFYAYRKLFYYNLHKLKIGDKLNVVL